jgi:hypothetical protein
MSAPAPNTSDAKCTCPPPGADGNVALCDPCNKVGSASFLNMLKDSKVLASIAAALEAPNDKTSDGKSADAHKPEKCCEILLRIKWADGSWETVADPADCVTELILRPHRCAPGKGPKDVKIMCWQYESCARCGRNWGSKRKPLSVSHSE